MWWERAQALKPDTWVQMPAYHLLPVQLWCPSYGRKDANSSPCRVVGKNSCVSASTSLSTVPRALQTLSPYQLSLLGVGGYMCREKKKEKREIHQSI